MNMGFSLVLKQEYEPHKPMHNPDLTVQASCMELPGLIEDTLDEILAKGKLKPREQMLQTEAVLLSLWKYGKKWDELLDSPLISHADAAITLKKTLGYDAVVAIKEAGIFYADVFMLMGLHVFEIDYSHHRRNMKKPEMDMKQLNGLKEKKNALIVDVDFVTGKTLREVVGYLRERGVNVEGAYVGLSEWPGIESDNFYIGHDRVDFDSFWICNREGLNHLRTKKLHSIGFLPKETKIFSPNPALGDSIHGQRAARRVACYLREEMGYK